MSKGINWEKLSPETRAMLEKASELIVPMRCPVTIEVREDGEYRREDRGTPIRCGKALHPVLGCVEKFPWGGTHGLPKDRGVDGMVFRDIDPLPPVSSDAAGEDSRGLTLDGLEDVGGYKPHPVTDGGVGSGGKRRLSEGDSGRRKLVIVDGEIAGVVLGFLPKKFVFFYELLADLAYGERRLDASGAMAPSEGGRQKVKKSNGRTSTNGVDKTLAASGRGKSKNHGEIQFKDERAVDFRRLVDRKLRRIAREIEEFLAGGDGSSLRSGKRRCSGRCGKIGDPEWMFCARCGGPMMEVD